jgi:hypothetical protein
MDARSLGSSGDLAPAPPPAHLPTHNIFVTHDGAARFAVSKLLGEGYEATNNLDFSAHYNFTPHLKATLEGLDLTDRHIVQYTDIPTHRIEVNTSSGRTHVMICVSAARCGDRGEPTHVPQKFASSDRHQ